MGDMGEVFRAMRQERKKRHERWHDANRKILDEAGIPYADRGEALLFREKDKPMVDFYPSTGRWRIPGTKVTFSGGAKAFLGWYSKQNNEKGRV